MNYLSFAYWHNLPRPEGVKAWEKRHVGCLQQRDGKPYYDWHAAKKVGRRNGQVPAGLMNGLVGRGVYDEQVRRELVERYNRLIAVLRALTEVEGREADAARQAGVELRKAEELLRSANYFGWLHGYWPGHRIALLWTDGMPAAYQQPTQDEYEAASPVVHLPEPPTDDTPDEPAPRPKRARKPAPSPIRAKYEEYVACVTAAGINPRSFGAWEVNYLAVNSRTAI